MSDERYTPEVGSWLKGREVAPPDSESTARRVASRLPHVRQRSRWWPFPIFYRTTGTSTATDTPEGRPDLIAATNGHTPTVIRRTQSMLSPAKAIAAGAIVFALGGAFLIAQPFGEQGPTVPGAEAPAPPVAVSGTVTAGDCPVQDTIGSDNGHTTYRDGYCNPTWSLDDPRFGGIVTWATNADRYFSPGLAVDYLGVTIVDDEGAWRMLPEVLVDPGTGWPTGPLPRQFVMVGEGAYDGYYAVFTYTLSDTSDVDGTVDGYVVQGELPPVPSAASAP